MGTDAFSARRAESFRRFLLLPPPSYRKSQPQRLKAASVSAALRHSFGSAQGRLELVPFPICDESRRIFESALVRVRRSIRLQVSEKNSLRRHRNYRRCRGPSTAKLLRFREAVSSLRMTELMANWRIRPARTAPLKPKNGLNGPPVPTRR
jgi:hypothetical protein